MQPRDHQAAARTVSILFAVPVVATVVFIPIAPQTHEIGALPVAMATLAIVLVALMSVLARVFVAANRLSWAFCPLFAVAALVVIDLLTYDASVAAQIFFLFPALYGASLLPPRGAVVMTAASLVGEIVVVGVQLPVREALTDAGYVGASLVTAAVLLAVSSERQARLVTSLKQQAAIDPLTGLVTRRVLDEAASSALSGALSDHGTSLVLLDVDKFKSVNDRYGHPGGDRVLVQLADLLGRGSRRGDVVCRMGGDEIALLLPGCSGEAALRRAEQIVVDVRAHSFEMDDDVVISVSVSVGLAHAPTDADNLHTLYAAADAALYRAKQSGRNQVGAPSRP